MEQQIEASAQALAQALTPSDLDETLNRITAGAVDVLDDVDYASITIRHSDGTLETVAPTDTLLCDIDEAQYRLGEGPCYEAAAEVGHVATPDLANDVRFPRYADVAVRAGIHAQLGLRLFEAPGFVGALNLYSRRAGAFTDPEELSALFAHQSAMTIQYARELRGMKQAAQTRATVGAAVGIAIERYGLSESRAFAFLSRLAARHQVDVLEAARALVAASEGRDG